jgi:hypothetical protein
MLDGLIAQLERIPDQDIIRDTWVGAPASISTVLSRRSAADAGDQRASCFGASSPHQGCFCPSPWPKPNSALEEAPKGTKGFTFTEEWARVSRRFSGDVRGNYVRNEKPL